MRVNSPDLVDREREAAELAALLDQGAHGLVLSGAVKWNQKPAGAEVHWQHLDALRRLADSGHEWAHALAPKSPLLYVAAGGFSAGFRQAIRNAEQPLTRWSVEDLYRP